MAKNKVIAGDYLNKKVLKIGFTVEISIGFVKGIQLTKETVEEYEVITEETRKSASSGIIRGAVGATLLGPVGLLAGLSAKNKSSHTVAIKFKDGKNSLIEIDEKIYKQLIQNLF